MYILQPLHHCSLSELLSYVLRMYTLPHRQTAVSNWPDRRCSISQSFGNQSTDQRAGSAIEHKRWRLDDPLLRDTRADTDQSLAEWYICSHQQHSVPTAWHVCRTNTTPLRCVTHLQTPVAEWRMRRSSATQSMEALTPPKPGWGTHAQHWHRSIHDCETCEALTFNPRCVTHA